MFATILHCAGCSRDGPGEAIVKGQPRAHDPREKGLRAKAMDHRIHCQPVDDEVTKCSSKSLLPFDWIDGYARLFLKQAAVTLDPVGRIISRRLRRQHETEKLGQITLRRSDSCKLPVVGAQALARCQAVRGA